MNRPLSWSIAAACIFTATPEAWAQRASSTKAAAVESTGRLVIEQPTEWSSTGARGIVLTVRKSVRVVGTADHPSGIEEITINGGKAVLTKLEGGGVRFSGYMPVDDSTTAAEIVGRSESGEEFTKRYPVSPKRREVTPASPQEAFDSASSGFKGRRYAVVIGVSKYRDSRVPALKYADRDAKSFYDFLRSERAGLGGIPSENIRVLLNQDATFLNIRKALMDFLKVPTEDDVVYIYFAGHGSPDPDRTENLYLLPYDVEADNIASSAMPMEDVQKALKRVYARQVVLIVDACHSAGVSDDAERRAVTSLNDINRMFTERLEQSAGGTATFTASEKTQQSQEGEQWGGGHGVFTYFMIDALKGQADVNRDYIVSLGEMMEYTRTQVMRETRNAQIPSIAQTAIDREWPMAVVLPGDEIPEISDDEIKKAAQVSNVMSNAFDFPWKSADSLVAVVGVSDTVLVHLQNDNLDVLPSHLLSWSTSNSNLLQVDSFGVIRAVAPGNASVTARGFNRRITIPVKIYDRPRQIVFTPADTSISLVTSERFDVRADLLVGTGLWIRGLSPKMTQPDTLVLVRGSDGGYVAIRDGTTRLTGQIAGAIRNWNIEIRPPLVRIQRTTSTLLLGDSLPLSALRARHDHVALGEALGVVWETSDTSALQVRGAYAHARRVGRAKVIANLGPYADTASLSIVGDLLVTTNNKGLQTVSVETGESFRIGADSIHPVDAALSPNGEHIVFASGKDHRLYIMNSEGSNLRRLAPEYSGTLMRGGSYEEHSPRWTFDGKRIVFVSNRPGNYEIFNSKLDGTDVQRVTSDGAIDWHVATAPDVARVAFERVVGAGDGNVFVSMADGSEQVAITESSGIALRVSETRPQLLPGGSRMLFARGAPGLDRRAGETLTLYNIPQKAATRDLVKPIKDHEIRYALSPDGTRVAYHMRATWGRKNASIAVIDLDGNLLKTVNLGKDVEIREISWGAVPLKPEKKP